MEFSVEGRSGEIRFQGQCSGVHAVEWADCREDLTGIIWIVKSEMDPAPKFSRQYLADKLFCALPDKTERFLVLLVMPEHRNAVPRLFQGDFLF